MSLLIASMVVLGSGATQGQSLAQAIECARSGRSFAVRWYASAGTGHDGWGAEHPALDMRARFAAGAIEIEPASAPGWRWSLRLVGIGRAQSSLALGEVALDVDRDVVALGHAGAAEQFVHCDRGWEHTLSIAAPPAGARGANVEVRYALATDLDPLLDADARGIAFFDGCGSAVLTYRGLAVWDAAGRRLPARLALDGGELRATIDDAGACYPLLVDPLIATSETKLISSSGSVNSGSGGVVTIDGDTAVVRESNNSTTGRFVVFERGAAGWAETAIIISGGINADLDGDWLLLGDGYWGWTGEAWLYHRVGQTWTYTPGLECPVPNFTCEPQTFGYCLDIDGDTAVVGETERTCPFGPSAYIAEFNAANQQWRYQTRIGIPTVAAALDGDDMLLASPVNVRYYHRSAFGAPFNYVSTLVSTNTYYAYRDIDLHDGVAVVKYSTQAKAEIYERHGTQFALVGTIPLTSGTGSSFAKSAHVVDGLVAVGDWKSNLAAASAGAVKLWTRNGGWIAAAEITASDAAAGDGFGASADLDRRAPARTGRLIAGAPAADIGGAGNQGAAYVVDLAHQEALVYCTSKINSQNCIPRIAFSGTASVSSGAPFALSCINVLNQRIGVFFYGTSGRDAAPFQGSFRCVANPTRRAGQYSSGGNTGTVDCSGVLALDFNATIQSGVDPTLVLGTVVDGQFWYRDGAASFHTGLSEAIEFAIGP